MGAKDEDLWVVIFCLFVCLLLRACVVQWHRMMTSYDPQWPLKSRVDVSLG